MGINTVITSPGALGAEVLSSARGQEWKVLSGKQGLALKEGGCNNRILEV